MELKGDAGRGASFRVCSHGCCLVWQTCRPGFVGVWSGRVEKFGTSRRLHGGRKGEGGSLTNRVDCCMSFICRPEQSMYGD